MGRMTRHQATLQHLEPVGSDRDYGALTTAPDSSCCAGVGAWAGPDQRRSQPARLTWTTSPTKACTDAFGYRPPWPLRQTSQKSLSPN